MNKDLIKMYEKINRARQKARIRVSLKRNMFKSGKDHWVCPDCGSKVYRPNHHCQCGHD